jgi:hypothetical protein
MTTITVQDGQIILRDGKVGTEQECCCIECQCPACSETFVFTVVWAGVTATTGQCFGAGNYTGFGFFADDNSFAFVNVSATCNQGNWTLEAVLSYGDPECVGASRYSLQISCADVEEDGFPAAGAVTLQRNSYEFFPEDCGPGGPASATVTK